jgi:hypothetical protein
MAKASSSGAKKSKGRTDTTKVSREAPGSTPRAHRDDTPEAKQQRERMPKTHPTSNPTAARKSPAGKDSKAHNVQQATGATPRHPRAVSGVGEARRARHSVIPGQSIGSGIGVSIGRRHSRCSRQFASSRRG